ISAKSIQVIQKNKQALECGDEALIIKKDVIEFLRKYSGPCFDNITIDPPFPSKICLKTLEALANSQACGANTRIVIEHSKHEPLPNQIGNLTLIDSRDYGDKLLSFFSQEH
ncbi:MAG: RsmD family RNA methyltransferase, partial [Oligoflexia bacterium]|nr:RsmD family RNA methyltransferase [Oligoflexia bacterium]